ncbi:glycoside hydrolase family 29 protein [Schizophyllum amplum]|uniref:alpha-L-fucosidase n=1 Tax=Schizophyllum amplum TaxID=97359 RepID=A0A550C557_9AGAR|nr:glycoside hydrolase family 29 protein [Auriculariopsis ampla]
MWPLFFCFCLATARAAFVNVDLSEFFNIKAASTGVNDTLADFDGSGRAYPVEYLPSETVYEYRGIQFTMPPFHDAESLDAVRSDAQTISLPGNNSTYHSFHALATSTWPVSSHGQARAGNLTLHFADDSDELVGLIVAPWYSDETFDGPIHTPWHYANATLDYNTTVDHNITHIHYVTARLPSDRPLASLSLPMNTTYIKWFAISLQEAASATATSTLRVQHVRSTTKWIGSVDVQQIEVVLDNLAPLSSDESQWITSRHNVSIESDALTTVIPASFQRLRSNDQVLLKIGVRLNEGVPAGTEVSATIVVRDLLADTTVDISSAAGWPLTVGIQDWEATDDSLATHESPEWFDDAKFGIFIHWGVYSVPAWAPTGVQYAEWYNWQFHDPPNASSPTWTHHLETYGKDVVYDDFIDAWDASAWDPDTWVDLFAEAGARYFVITTKHHEGFTLFDAGNSTNRSSVIMGPKRDLLGDLFASAKAKQPEMRRGTYFSLPEWYHPDYEPYGRAIFPGRPALNAFTGECCDPYVGYIPVDDFLEGVQRPQMEKLFHTYDTDILWCDIAGASVFSKIAADWYNYAASQDRQVVRNNRCGSNQADFVTPEYATFSAQLSQKWESNSGIDPFSYGYNSDTPSYGYANASDLIVQLIDIVSKGGNYLLDIGPMANGTIVGEEVDALRGMGTWLKHSGTAIYGTRPWFLQVASAPADGLTDARFTTTADAFYIIAIERPTDGMLRVRAPIPAREGDVVTMLGGDGGELEWSADGDVFSVAVSEEDLGMVQYAWAFKVEYR